MAAKQQSRADQLERRQQLELVKAALAKQQQGVALSRTELTALKRHYREEEERHGLAFVERVPKGTYREWSGRQVRTLHAQADLYGLPIRESTVSLPELVRWLHDWLAKHKHDLPAIARQADGATPADTLRDKKLVEQIRGLEHKNAILERDLAEARGEVVPRDLVQAMLDRVAKTLRKAGEQLYKRHGTDAGDLLAAALARLDDTIAELADDHDLPPQRNKGRS